MTEEGIQLLYLQFGGEGVLQNAKVCKLGERGDSRQSEHLPVNFSKAYPDLQKEKGIQKWAGILVKSGKRSTAVQKEYH